MSEEEQESTKHQEDQIKACYTKNGLFILPCCKESVTLEETIENPGEDKTQIYCPYCRMYLFLEDYNLIIKQ